MHVFVHNGDLPGIERSVNLAFDRYRPVGTTDSENAFCALLERIGELWNASSLPPPVDKRLSVVTQFAADLRKLGPANFLYADGESLFAHSHRRVQPATGDVTPPGLFLLSRRCADADEPVLASGMSVAPGFQEVLLIASVALTDEYWQPFADGELVAVSSGHVFKADMP